MTEQAQLEQAIAALEAQRAILGDAVVETALAPLREKLAAMAKGRGGEQQRKQITVLFADVSGFTAMSETMDAEDVTEMMNYLWEPLDTAITDHGGVIDKHIGDAVMALWGTDQAREDDPERATRAALDMQVALATFREERNVQLTMRIGLNTGPVLLGQVGTTGEYTAMGNTVNLASRLEHAAPLGGVLISHDTYRHVRGIFDVQSLEPIQVKGKAEPIQVYVVQRAKPRAFRQGTRGVEGIETHMVGREVELKRLQDVFCAAMDGQRQVVTIVGEAGVGKSRLLYEFQNWGDLLPQQIYLFKGRASQEMQNIPYALIRDLFAFRFQIQDSDQASVVREKMEWGIYEALGEDDGGQIKAHFIGQLLGFDFSDSPHLRGVLDDAKQIHDRALIYISDYFKAMTAQFPTRILLDDIHWADDSSLDAINHLARATPNQRLLIVCLTRPILFERRAHWGQGQAFHTKLELHPLSKQDSHRLVEEILQKVEQVPAALRELVVGGAEGNPFYVEELIKMLIEDNVIVKGEDHWRVEPVRLTSVRVPPTLTGVLQARLDSLPPEERTTLQRASVVGRTFWDKAVRHLSTESEPRGTPYAIRSTGEGIASLRGRELIFQRATSAFAETQEYIFKHAILRKVTYESVLKRLRRVYHALVAEWLIERSGERAGEVTGLIADHLELAGQTEDALAYLRRAGEQAAAQLANTEAVNYLSRALDLTPDPEVATAGRYDLLLAREKVYDVQGAREAQRQDLAALQELAETLSDERRQAEVSLRQANYAEVTGDYPAAVGAAQATIRLAQAASDVSNEAAGYLHWGRALWRQGDFETARPRLEQALALGRDAGLRQVEADSLRNLGIVCGQQGDYAGAGAYFEQALRMFREINDRRGESAALNPLGIVAAGQGDYAGARDYFGQVLRIYREIGDRQGEGIALSNLGEVSSEQGDYAGAGGYFEQSLRICREIGDRQGEGAALNNLGEVSAAQGDYAGARAYYEQALNILREIGNRRIEGVALGSLALVYLRLGDYASSGDYCEQALRICREIGDRQSEGLALAHLGLLSHQLGDDEAAREHSRRALLIAQELGDRPTQAYAQTHLGHALAGLGSLIEAADAHQQALALRRELGQPNLAMEPLTGLARVSLAQGDTTQAQAQVDKILSHLESGTLDGAVEPFRVHLTCFRVLCAVQDPRAPQVLTTAHTLLQERAGKIDDEELRRSFLENVAAHREIVGEWRVANSE